MKKLLYIIIAVIAFVVLVNSCSEDANNAEQRIESGQNNVNNETENNQVVNNNSDSKVKKSENVSNWKYETTEDKMRNTKMEFANLASENSIDFGFPYGKSKANLTLRRSQDGVDVVLSVDSGQFNCAFDGCGVDVKFGDSAIKSYTMGLPDNGRHDILFLDGGVQDFVNELKKSEAVIIEAPFFDFGRAQYEFNTSGLEWQ